MRPPRWSALLVIATIVVVASGHVTVTPRQIDTGTGGDFVFRVPTERPVATIKLHVEFPDGFTVSRIRSKLGWTTEVVRDTSNAITAATWSGGKIGPDEYDEFVVAARISAAAGTTIALRALQTYENGEVVAWESVAEPMPREARPAPRIAVTAAPSKFATAARGNLLGGIALLMGFAALTMSLRKGNNGKDSGDVK